MKTLNSYNGCSKNSKKMIAEAKKLMEYDVPLTAYEEEEREFAAKYNIEVNIDSIPIIEDAVSRVLSSTFEPSDLSEDPDENEIWNQQSLASLIDEEVTKFYFYLAAQGSSDGLIALIVRAVHEEDNDERKGPAAGLLEKIVLGKLTNHYSPEFLILAANCLLGCYTFHTIKRFDRAKGLYQLAIDKLKAANGRAEYLDMAEKRIVCCDLLLCSLDDLPQDSLLNTVAGNAATDDFSGVALAFVYLTTPDYKKKKPKGRQLLNAAFYRRYRPAIYLHRYLGEKKVLDNYREEALEDFIEAADLRPLEDIFCDW